MRLVGSVLLLVTGLVAAGPSYYLVETADCTHCDYQNRLVSDRLHGHKPHNYYEEGVEYDEKNVGSNDEVFNEYEHKFEGGSDYDEKDLEWDGGEHRYCKNINCGPHKPVTMAEYLAMVKQCCGRGVKHRDCKNINCGPHKPVTMAEYLAMVKQCCGRGGNTMVDMEFASNGFIKFLRDSNQPLDQLTERNLENLYNLIFKIEFERNQNTNLGNLAYTDLSRYMVDKGIMNVNGVKVIFNL